MKERLRQLLERTLTVCGERGLLQRDQVPPYQIEVPNNPSHGHFATNLPLTLASSQKRNPRAIAATLVENLQDDAGLLDATEIAGPGFINFRIARQEWFSLVASILAAGKDYGRCAAGEGQKIVLEYISANPTGPLHLGHGRGAALGDSLSRILRFCGYETVREFYVNDAGVQIRMLGQSIYARYLQVATPDYPFPEQGYHGEYVRELARTIAAEQDLGVLSPEEAIALCAERGRVLMLAEIQQSLAEFRVLFDVWFSESDLYRAGHLERVLDGIRAKGYLFEADGALWIRTSEFGDDKDRVIRKSDGEYTYFAADIAYHLDKYARGFNRAINIWGADHHGYVPRMRAALVSSGLPQDWLAVLLIQLVKLWKRGQEVKMSKRAGSFVTLTDLIQEVGVDAVRFVFLTKSHDSALDFDVDLVTKQDADNPVYYVQYAHARICSLFRKAGAEGLDPAGDPMDVLEHLALEEEMALIRQMTAFPSLLQDICLTLEPHRLTYYLTELAAAFHRYFNLGNKNPECRIVTADRPRSQARLALVDALRTVIANGLELLGVSAPTQM